MNCPWPYPGSAPETGKHKFQPDEAAETDCSSHSVDVVTRDLWPSEMRRLPALDVRNASPATIAPADPISPLNAAQGTRNGQKKTVGSRQNSFEEKVKVDKEKWGGWIESDDEEENGSSRAKKKKEENPDADVIYIWVLAAHTHDKKDPGRLIHPDSVFFNWWGASLAVAVLVDSILTPISIAWSEEDSETMRAIMILIDCWFAVNIVISFRTGDM